LGDKNIISKKDLLATGKNRGKYTQEFKLGESLAFGQVGNPLAQTYNKPIQNAYTSKVPAKRMEVDITLSAAL